MSTTKQRLGLKVLCIITGKPSYFNSEILKKKIEEFGNIQEVEKTYICRDAIRMLREGKTQQEIRLFFGLSNDNFTPVDIGIINKIIGTQKKIISKTNSNVNINQVSKIGQWDSSEFKVPIGWDQIPANIAEITKETCVRPDIYFSGVCEPCKYFSICELPIKRIKGKIQRNKE